MNKPQPNETVSHATLRDTDLIEAFTQNLAYYAPDKAEAIKAEYAKVYDYLDYHGHLDDYQDQETVSWLINESLFDALDAISPEGCYFGTLDGDGACFGWWQCEDEDE